MRSLLGDGLVLRPATAQDLPGVAHLLGERGEPSDAVDFELIVGTEGHAGVGVVVDGDRVVSTTTLLDETVHIDGIPVPAGQVDLVATDPAYERRGLVRALLEWAHDRSRQHGHLLQVMIGVPYFYRQFGYEYVTPMPAWRPLVSAPTPAADLTIRKAGSGDIAAMQVLQDAAQAAVDVRVGHSPACWGWLLERDGSDQWVAERDGAVVGVARTVPPSEEPLLSELAAADDDAALALVADAAQRVDATPDAEGPLVVQDRRCTPPVVRALLGEPTEKPDWYLARIERLAPLLEHLAPALQERLTAAGLADRDHDVLLSSWRSHLRFRIGPSGFALDTEGGPEQAPISKGGSGVPPDAIAALLLGPYGAVGLEARLPDCHLGRQRDLMAALFPPRTADLLTFYLAT